MSIQLKIFLSIDTYWRFECTFLYGFDKIDETCQHSARIVKYCRK